MGGRRTSLCTIFRETLPVPPGAQLSASLIREDRKKERVSERESYKRQPPIEI
jgi:hypothetical protein